MNAETFLKQLGHLADAPNGVQKLRELVLQLAVTGRSLGPRSSGNANGKATSRVGDFLSLQNGYAFKSEWFGRSGVRLVRNANVAHGSLNWDDMVCLSEKQAEEYDRFRLNAGDIVISLDRPLISTGLKAAIIQDSDLPSLLLQRVGRVQFKDDSVLPEFFFRWLKSPCFMRAIDPGRSNGVPHISSKDVESVSFAPPPVAEQHRIVAKVDELLALCDELETQQARRTVVRTAFAAASLARLTAAPTPVETAGEWSRVAQHFDTLFAVPQTIPQLRQTILQLAVTGRLVEQDEGEGTASDLCGQEHPLPGGMERLRKTLNKKVLTLACELVADLPESWISTTIDDLYSLGILIEYADGNHGSSYPKKSEFGAEGVTYVTAKDLVGGKVRWGDCQKLREAKAQTLRKGWAKAGDVLLTHNATVGRTALVEADVPDFLLGTSVTFYRLNEDVVGRDFFHLILQSPVWQSQLEAVMKQTTRNQVSIQKQALFTIPIAPRKEQHRIVGAATWMLEACDTLESQLTARQRAAERLTAAMVQGVLDGAAHEPTSEPMPRDPQQDRAAIAARIVQRLHERPHFGSVHFAKVFYTAVTHTGLDLGITFQRQKAGPLWTGLYPLRDAGQRDGWLRYAKAAADGEPDRYQAGPQIAPLLQYSEHLLAGRAADFDRILDLFSALDTRRAELIATAYAVWNDFLLAGETPSDARIVKDFRENWHSEKAKFPAVEIRQGLAWLRENGLTPTGRGTATTPQ